MLIDMKTSYQDSAVEVKTPRTGNVLIICEVCIVYLKMKDVACADGLESEF